MLFDLHTFLYVYNVLYLHSLYQCVHSGFKRITLSCLANDYSTDEVQCHLIMPLQGSAVFYVHVISVIVLYVPLQMTKYLMD
jgi:hypothetical protein